MTPTSCFLSDARVLHSRTVGMKLVPQTAVTRPSLHARDPLSSARAQFRQESRGVLRRRLQEAAVSRRGQTAPVRLTLSRNDPAVAEFK